MRGRHGWRWLNRRRRKDGPQGKRIAQHDHVIRIVRPGRVRVEAESTREARTEQERRDAEFRAGEFHGSFPKHLRRSAVARGAQKIHRVAHS